MQSPKVHHPLFARFYSCLLEPMSRRSGLDDLRRRHLAGLAGTVVEVGSGDGANFSFYPVEVVRVVAVEPESYLRERAAVRAEERIDLRDGVAESLPVADASADAVVLSLVLCSVEDQAAALAEARRVLRPGGEVRFLEHVRSESPGLARVQRVLDATVWPRLFGGCHVSRDTVDALAAAGLEVKQLERVTLPEDARGPALPAVLGVAVVP